MVRSNGPGNSCWLDARNQSFYICHRGQHEQLARRAAESCVIPDRHDTAANPIYIWDGKWSNVGRASIAPRCVWWMFSTCPSHGQATKTPSFFCCWCCSCNITTWEGKEDSARNAEEESRPSFFREQTYTKNTDRESDSWFSRPIGKRERKPSHMCTDQLLARSSTLQGCGM